MYFRSLASWLLFGYFTPFIAFFFAIFWFGLHVWTFLTGMLVVSFLTLLLFLKVKDWEMRAQKLLLNANKPKVVVHKETLPLKFDFSGTPSYSITLISCDLKASLEHDQKQHEVIVKAYEEERNKLFCEIANLQNSVKENQAMQEEIKSLKFEIETLLGMDKQLLQDALSECSL